nr:MAG: major capsid protein [Microviridae sp.]
MEKITLGGERLGTGGKMQVGLDGFQRSNHNLSYQWRSSMSAGTLVPFMCEIGLPGDTIDIGLQGVCLTHPTLGPLFGSYKIQYDVFQVPIRLYNSWLHNNKLEVGRNMSQVKLPKIYLESGTFEEFQIFEGWEQVNPSCLLAYLGIRGIGATGDTDSRQRSFNGTAVLAYYEIYKNYYANKQEEIGVMIDANILIPVTLVKNVGTGDTMPMYPTVTSATTFTDGDTMTIAYTGIFNMYLFMIFNINTNEWDGVNNPNWGVISDDGSVQTWQYNSGEGEAGVYEYWRYVEPQSVPSLTTFALSNIDQCREELLATAGNVDFEVNRGYSPYNWFSATNESGITIPQFGQQGLCCKTYQSDIFNNWLNEAWISDVATQSAVSVISGQFTIDELTIKKKVWELLNRIAVSGGSYDDWIFATYDQKPFNRAESPVYIGGMSQELVFQQVISNASAIDQNNNTQPLGTLAGRGTIDHKQNKGGNIVAKCTEHCYLIGIVSLTPRIDYSQGNRWDVNLDSMDDFHKPSLDQIGFQDLIEEQMAWFSTFWYPAGSEWLQNAAGKQPAWINYQTNFNRTFGNFAIPNNEMFMTLNRRYDMNYADDGTPEIADLTTYIDPSKFNFIFAEVKLDAQNFWMQIGVNIEARRKMSAKIMPNL